MARKSTTKDAELSILRMNNSKTIVIKIEDPAIPSRIARVAEVELSYEAFAQAITGLCGIPCKTTLYEEDRKCT